jgi:hypothetical protein
MILNFAQEYLKIIYVGLKIILGRSQVDLKR